ncbi:GspH/FimT family pseudopilin [Methylocaldum sp. MU1018]
MKTDHEKGFTLIELMVAVAVAAVVLTTAVPSFQEIVRNNRLATQANQLVTSLNLARSEAVKRSVRVTICKSADPAAAPPSCATSGGWEQGWMVFVDGGTKGTVDTRDTILGVFGKLEGTTLSAGGNFSNWISYLATGFSEGETSLPNSTFKLCSGGAKSKGKNIVINRTGRVRVEDATC